MKTIKISVNYRRIDCEDCGMGTYVTSRIKLPDREEIVIEGDDHLGGGPIHSEDILEAVLKELGYEVEWEEV